MVFTYIWSIFSFLNNINEFCLYFLSTSLNVNPHLTCTCVLWLLLLFLCYLVGVPSLPTVWETKNRKKHHGRAKRRRKGGTRKGCRYYQREEEERKRLISILKSPLGQHYDTTRFRRMLCPDPVCEVCNHATAEFNSILSPDTLEDASTSVSASTSTVSMSDSSIRLSPTFSVLPPGTAIPAPPSEPSSSPPPTLSTNPTTPLPSSPSPLPPGHTLPPDPFCAMESKFPGEISHLKTPKTPSCDPPEAEHLLQPETPLTLNVIFIDPILAQIMEPSPDLSLTMNPTDSFAPDQVPAVQSISPSPDCSFTMTESEQYQPEHFLNASESAADKPDSVVTIPFGSSKGNPTELLVHQQPSYPKAGEDFLQESHICFFWGLPNLHSESLPSVAHVLGEYSSVFLFNAIPNASTCQVYPTLVHPLPPSLPEAQPQPSPETLPEDHLLSSLPMLPSDPTPQSMGDGGNFHRSKNKSGTISESERQNLAWHILRKQQERLWGLPSIVKRSLDEFHSSDPNSDCKIRQLPQDQVSVSILPGDFTLSDEVRKTLEHHLRKRLIQHRWGLPRRIHESLSLLRPLRHCSETAKSRSNYGVSSICASKGQNSFSEWGSKMFPADEDGVSGEEKSEESSKKGDISNDSKHSSSELNQAYESEEDPGGHRQSFLGENAMYSVLSPRQREIENFLKTYSNKKVEDINVDVLPGSVPSALQATEQVPPPSVNSHTETKQKTGPPSVGLDCCLDTCQELCFLECCAQESLDSHMKTFCGRMSCGLPSKVLESIQLCQLKDSSSRSFLNSNLPCPVNQNSDVGSRSGVFTPLTESNASLHGDMVGTAHSSSVLDRPPSTTLHAGQEGQRDPSQELSDIYQVLIRDIERMRDVKEALTPVTQSITVKESPEQTILINTPSPKQPAVQAGTKHEAQDQNVTSIDRLGKQKGKGIEKESQLVSMPMISHLFMAKEFNAFESRPSDTLPISKPKITQRIPVNQIKEGAPVSTEFPPAKMPVLQDPTSSTSKEQLSNDLQCEIQNRENNEAQGQCSELSIASDGSQTQGVSSVDTGAAQVIHVHMEDRGVTMQQRQEPWIPEHLLRSDQDKNSPQVKRRVSRQGCRTVALGGGDTGSRTSQAGRKTIPQEMSVDRMLGRKYSETPLQEVMAPPERPFRVKMKCFIQWLLPGAKCKQQENSKVKGSPVSPVRSKGPEKSRGAALPGPTEAPKILTVVGKLIQEKPGCTHATHIPCSQGPLPTPVKCGKLHQKAEVRAHTGLMQGHHFSTRAPCCKITKSCQEAAGFAGQSFRNVRQTTEKDRQPHQKVTAFQEQVSYEKNLQSWTYWKTMDHLRPGQSSASIRQVSNKDRQAQKSTAFKEQLLCQKHLQSRPQKEAVPHSSGTYRPPAGQGPKAVLTTAHCSNFRDESRLLSHKSLKSVITENIFPLQSNFFLMGSSDSP